MKKILLFAFSIVSIIKLSAQDLTRDDYKRAVSFLWGNLTNKKVYNINTQLNWLSDSSGAWFTYYTKDGKTFFKIDPKKGKTEPLFDHQRLAKLIGDTLKKEIKPTELPFTFMRYIDKTHWEIAFNNKNYTLNLVNYSLSIKKDEEENKPLEQKSPDGKWIAFSKNHNLYIKLANGGEEKQLSKDGFSNYEYGSYYDWGELIEGENGTRPPHLGVSWSPDSKWIQTYICDLRIGNKMYLLDWSIDTLFRPKLLSYYRGSPGDTDMVYMIPVFFNVETGEEIRQDQFRNVNATDYDWSKTEPGICYVENGKRGYQQADLYRFAPATKQLDKIFTETSSTNIDGYSSQLTDEPGKIIIYSERSGWRQLYLLDATTQALQPITKGDFFVNDILYTDKKSKTIYFTASGKEAGRNPYHLHFYKIKMDGSGLTLLTPEDANHDITVSPDGKYFSDNLSTLNTPTRSLLRDMRSGKVIKEFSHADVSGLLAMNFQLPQPFTATGRDGTTTLYGAIWKPSNFDSTKHYPVIDQTYTGPHTFMYPRNFTSAIVRSNQALAELGFIVIAVDGMGTANRSKAFHNVSYKNMGKNLLDHVLAIRELGKRYPWVDTSRVGIFGHSAGGYDAGHAVLEFPDFYKVAVASSADHDFRMEKDWWPEMYMGWPVDSTYHQVSNITMAPNLKGKLLITHGGIDENVNPSATFKLAEALIKADKEFDMLIIPSQHHGYQGKYNDYFTKKKWNYFIEHLLGSKTIWDFELR